MHLYSVIDSAHYALESHFLTSQHLKNWIFLVYNFVLRFVQL